MVKQLPDGIHLMNMDSAVELWNEDNPDDLYSRSKVFHPITGDLENWLIRVVNGEVIGLSGFTIKDSFAYVGGLKGRKGTKGTTESIHEAREEWIQRRPKVAGFSAKRGNPKQWVEKFKEWGWTINPDQFEDVPEEVINTMKENYGENWGIKKRIFWKDILFTDEMLIRKDWRDTLILR